MVAAKPSTTPAEAPVGFRQSSIEASAHAGQTLATPAAAFSAAELMRL
jgi:hypothetical protein